MENMSRVEISFVLLGILELEKFWILCSLVSFAVYIIPTLLCCLIVTVIWAEKSLHEPMYIFICNLLLNGVFGNTSIFPQFIVHLLIGSSTISLPGCFTQTFCVHTFSTVELLTFTTMAYDRFLAVGNPLRYSSIMTNAKAFKYINAIWSFSISSVLIIVLLTANLRFCGVNINNIFCENMSLVRLACGGISVSSIFGLVETLLVLVCTLLTIFYCYIRTLLLCLKTSRSTSLKAINTLVTHIITFSIFMTATLFIFLRYRLNGGTLSNMAHVLISMTGILTSITFNPIIYGLRTKALKLKLIYNVQKYTYNQKHLPDKITTINCMYGVK